MTGVGRSTARPAIRASKLRVRTTNLGYGCGCTAAQVLWVRSRPDAGAVPGLIHRQGALGLRVQELRDELVVGVEELVGGARLDDPPLPEHRDEDGDPARRAEVVADDEIAAAVLLVHLADQLAEESRPHRVEARVGL